MLTHVGDSSLDLDALTCTGPLCRTYLYSRELVVLPEGVLVASDAEMLRERASERHERARAALKAAIERFVGSLERLERNNSSRAALVQVLLQLDQKDDTDTSFDVLPRALRGGWCDTAGSSGSKRVKRRAWSWRRRCWSPRPSFR